MYTAYIEKDLFVLNRTNHKAVKINLKDLSMQVCEANYLSLYDDETIDSALKTLFVWNYHQIMSNKSFIAYDDDRLNIYVNGQLIYNNINEYSVTSTQVTFQNGAIIEIKHGEYATYKCGDLVLSSLNFSNDLKDLIDQIKRLIG